MGVSCCCCSIEATECCCGLGSPLSALKFVGAGIENVGSYVWLLSLLLLGSGEKAKLGEKLFGSGEKGFVEKGIADDDSRVGWWTADSDGMLFMS